MKLGSTLIALVAPIVCALATASTMLEISPTTPPGARDVVRGATGVPAMAFTLTARGGDVHVSDIVFSASGDGDPVRDVVEGRLYRDLDANGLVNDGDTLVTNGQGPFHPVTRELFPAHWRLLPPPPPPSRGSVGVVSLDGFVYLLGGFGQQQCDFVDRYDPASGEWERIDQMPAPLSSFACVAHGGRIYVFGGLPVPQSQTARAYDPSTKFWHLLAPIPSQRSQVAAVAFGDEIFVFGGPYSDSQIAHAYHPESDTWRPLAPLAAPRTSFGAALWRNKIVLVGGGSSDINTLTSVDVYDPVADNWSELPSLQSHRVAPACMVIQDRLYVFGGKLAGTFGRRLQSVEVFDEQANRWRYDPSPMHIPRAGFGMVAIGDHLLAMMGTGANDGDNFMEVREPHTSLDLHLAQDQSASFVLEFDLASMPGPAATLQAQIALLQAEAVSNVTVLGVTQGGEIRIKRAPPARLEVRPHQGDGVLSYPRGTTGAISLGFSLTAEHAPVFVESLIVSSTGSGLEHLDVKAAWLYRVESGEHALGPDSSVVHDGAARFDEDDGILSLLQPWRPGGIMPKPTTNMAAVAVNDTIYSIGGSHVTYDQFYEHDPRSGTWDQTHQFHLMRANNRGVVIDNRIYVASVELNISQPRTSLILFDPTKNTMLGLPSMERRDFFDVAHIGDTMFVVGGQRARPLDPTLLAFDLQERQWRVAGSMPTSRYGVGAAVVDGMLYAMGGCSGYNCPDVLDVVEVYDPATETWTARAPMPTARTYLSCETAHGRVFVIGGSWTDAVEVYSPASDQWTKWAPMATRRAKHDTTRVGTRIYVVGGEAYVGDTWIGIAPQIEVLETALPMDIALAPGETASFLLALDFAPRSGPVADFHLMVQEVVAYASDSLEIVNHQPRSVVQLEQAAEPVLHVTSEIALPDGTLHPNEDETALLEIALGAEAWAQRVGRLDLVFSREQGALQPAGLIDSATLYRVQGGHSDVPSDATPIAHGTLQDDRWVFDDLSLDIPLNQVCRLVATVVLGPAPHPPSTVRVRATVDDVFAPHLSEADVVLVEWPGTDTFDLAGREPGLLTQFVGPAPGSSHSREGSPRIGLATLRLSAQTYDLLLGGLLVRLDGTADPIHELADLMVHEEADGIPGFSPGDRMLANAVPTTGLEIEIRFDQDLLLARETPLDLHFSAIAREVPAATSTVFIGALDFLAHTQGYVDYPIDASFDDQGPSSILRSWNVGHVEIEQRELPRGSFFQRNDGEVEVMAFDIRARDRDVDLTDIVFSTQGTAEPFHDIENFRLYQDNNANGLLDEGDTLIRGAVGLPSWHDKRLFAGGEWVSQASLPVALVSLGGVIVDDDLVVLGREHTGSSTSTGWFGRLAISAEEWVGESIALPSPVEYRGLHLVELNGRYFALMKRDATQMAEFFPDTRTFGVPFGPVVPWNHPYKPIALDGRVYFLESSDSFNAAGGFSSYSLSTAIRTLAPMPEARQRFAACAFEGRIYVFGGRTKSTAMSDVVLVYDPATDLWSTGEPMPTMRADHACVVLHGRIYVIGGMGSEGRIDVYDPTLDIWLPPVPDVEQRQDPTCIAWGGLIHRLGGSVHGALTTDVARMAPARANLNRFIPVEGASSYLLTAEIAKRPGPEVAFQTAVEALRSSDATPIVVEGVTQGHVITVGAAGVPTLEVELGALPHDGFVPRSATYAEAMSLTLRARNFPIDVGNLIFESRGGGDEAKDIAWAGLYEDRNHNGRLDPEDRLVHGMDRPFAKDDGRAAFVNIWRPVPPMPTERNQVCAAEFDGRLYVFGGDRFCSNTLDDFGCLDYGYLDRVEYYDRATRSWGVASPLPSPRSGAACAVLDNKIYVVGGKLDCGFLDRVDIYDPLTDTWTSGVPLPRTRYEHGCVALDGRLYVLGGVSREGLVAALDVFDPATQTWSQAADLPQWARGYNASAALDGRIIMVHRYNFDVKSPAYEYDPNGDVWRALPSFPRNVSGHNMVTLGNRAYMIGGIQPRNHADNRRLDLIAFNPVAEEWEHVNSLPALAQAGIVLATLDDELLAIGGDNDSPARRGPCTSNNMWAYAPDLPSQLGSIDAEDALSLLLVFSFTQDPGPDLDFRPALAEITAKSVAPVLVQGATQGQIVTLLDDGRPTHTPVPEPVLVVQPQVLSFSTDALELPLMIGNSGGRSLYWRAYAEDAWIQCRKANGQVTTQVRRFVAGWDNDTIAVYVQPDELDPGLHEGTVRVESEAGDETVSIVLWVDSPVPTDAPTETRTEAPVPTETPTEAPTSKNTESPTETNTPTPSASSTETPTEAPTPTNTESPTETSTPTPTASSTETPTEAPTATGTPSATESLSPTPTPTSSESPGVPHLPTPPSGIGENGTIDYHDLLRLVTAFAEGADEPDLNGDGLCDFQDVLIFSRWWMWQEPVVPKPSE